MSRAGYVGPAIIFKIRTYFRGEGERLIKMSSWFFHGPEGGQIVLKIEAPLF